MPETEFDFLANLRMVKEELRCDLHCGLEP